MKKGILCVFVCMLMIITLFPASGISLLRKIGTSLTTGNILYVGGSGPNNYTKIQEAINDTVDGDIVCVFDDSSPYYEQLTIETSITLKGENKNTTSIDGKDRQQYVIRIKSDEVTISGFTIQQSGWLPHWKAFFGIYISGNNSIIEGNIIQQCTEGIHCTSKAKVGHDILNNIIQNNREAGIAAYNVKNVTISGNLIEENEYIGIWVWGEQNTIFHNIVSANHFDGIHILGTLNNITENTVENHRVSRFWGTGIEVIGVNNSITRNNLINNSDQAFQQESGNLTMIKILRKQNNVWDANYWGEPLDEKRISGRLYCANWPFRFLWIPWNTYDSHPAQDPYDI